MHGSGHFGWSILAIALVLALQMAPVAWTGNEIDYFDLGLRWVRPEQFGPNHAVFDHSVARFASLGILGGLIELFGYDGALIVGRLIAIAAYAVAFAFMARSWKMSTAEAVGPLMLFLLVGQNYFAGEWMFVGVEGKVLAYAAILASIGLAWHDKHMAAVATAVTASYLHFLVGGFWGGAVILLIGLKTASLVSVGRWLLVYTVLCLPLLAILSYEWFLTPMPDMSGLDLTVNEIYAARAPHHVAPFSGDQLGKWLPGISWMAAATCLTGILALQQDSEVRVLARWLFILYVYLILSFVLAYFDRHTHLLGPLYMFRPNSLILLLTLMLGMLWLRQALAGDVTRTVAVITLAIAIGFAVPRAAILSKTLLLGAPQLPLTRALTPKYRELVGWLREHTHPDDTIVVEPASETNWSVRWLAFERLIERPTLVSYKFMPSQKADIVRWHQLSRWRQAVFEGDCSKVFEQPAAYLVTVNSTTLEQIADCGDVVWTNGPYTVVRVTKP
jgi:hypothetical protein